MPASSSSVSAVPKPRVMGTRIAQKILLGYVLPLAVLLVAGIVLPFLLWAFLGQATEDYENRARFAAQAEFLQKTADDTLEPARVYLRYHDKKSNANFLAARDEFRFATRDLRDYANEQADLHNEPILRDSVNAATGAYNAWLRNAVQPPLRQLERQQENNESVFTPEVSQKYAQRVSDDFEPVRARLAVLVTNAQRYRDRQKQRADALDLVRHITSIVIPIGAALSALLIARVLALGIVRPLEDLRRATEALESSDPARYLRAAGGADSEEMANDEIGDLQRAFRRMARTIRQREAVLRTQNEAVAALNRRIEAVLNSTNDGIMLLDKGGGFSLVNQKFAALFGLSMDELLDHTFAQAGSLLLSRFQDKAVVRRKLQEIIDDPEAIGDETFDIVQPFHRTLRVYSAPVRGESFVPDGSDSGTKNNGELLGRIFVFRDVTRETTVDRMKTEFVSTVSHELRTPLTAIKGYIDLMVSGQTGPVNEIQSEFLTMVQTSTERLTALINDMLDISRIESGRIELKHDEVDYLPLVEQTLRMMGGEAEAKQIGMAVSVKGSRQRTRVRGDADRITQVLINFLSNAIKYTPSGGKVEVGLEWEENFVTTCISDTGIGLTEDDMSRLFQKFFRADNSTTREVGGTGLGLAITKAILEKLNGSVWVESKSGDGSKFFFTLPTTDPLSTPAWGTKTLPEADKAVSEKNSVGSDPAAPALPANQCLILSVDGDVSVLHRVGHEMRRRGFVTASAATASEAARRARDLRPDVITLDPLTAGLDGFALLAALRAEPKTARVPVVLFGLRLVGGRAETENAHAFVPRQNASAQTLTPLIAAALAGSGSDGNLKGTMKTVLLVAGEETGESLQSLLAETNNAEVLLAASPEKADKLLGAVWPDLVIIDIQSAPSGEAGIWLARLKRRKPGATLPVIVLTETDILAGENVHEVTPFGGESLPLHQVSEVLTEILIQFRAENTPLGQTPQPICTP